MGRAGMDTIVALVLGAAWRRWFGSARPEWAPAWGYRGGQILVGVAVLWLVGASSVAAAVAVGFMTLPIHISRRPFEWIAERLPLPTTNGMDHPWKPMLQGPAPWAEVFQGATLWAFAIFFSA